MYYIAKNWTIIVLIFLLIIIMVVLSCEKKTQGNVTNSITDSTVKDKLTTYLEEHSKMLCIEGDWYILYYTNYGTSRDIRLLPTNKNCEAG